MIAVDWGTTNRRAYLVAAGGTVERSLEGGRGIMMMEPDAYPAIVMKLRQELGDHPILMAGMVGSNRGWVEVPYVPCPAGLAEIAARIRWFGPERVGIVPGVAHTREDICDVMRGEEVQSLGAMTIGRIPTSGLICLPGTHSKWVDIADGKIVALQTAMTGELFDLLRKHSILTTLLASAVTPGAVFRAGIDHALAHDDLTTELFRTRARVLLGRSPAESAASYVSGLLIGSDLRAALLQRHCERIAVIGAPLLVDLFVAAIEHVGKAAIRIEGAQAFVAGASRLMELVE